MSAHNIEPGSKMVFTHVNDGPRRKSAAELRSMSHLDQLMYHIHEAPPMNEVEALEALQREDSIARYQSGGEVSIVNDLRLYDDGPPDPSEA